MDKKAGHGLRGRQRGFTWHCVRDEEDDEDEEEKYFHSAESVETAPKLLEKRRPRL